MAYSAKDYSKLIGMEGFSETLLKNHFTLYQGYVTNTNKLLETVGQMLKDGKTGTPEYAEPKRRMGWEFNGMRLHEYYFENLGGKTSPGKNKRLSKELAENFGSYKAWEKDFKAPERSRIGCGAFQDPWPINSLTLGFNENIEFPSCGCTPCSSWMLFEQPFSFYYGPTGDLY